MGVNFLIIWAAIDPITRAVITETRVSRLGVAVMLRRGFRPLRLGVAVVLRRGFRPSRLGAAVTLRRGFRPSRLSAALIAMISPASGVWTLLFDDLSLVIFRQPTELLPKIFCARQKITITKFF